MAEGAPKHLKQTEKFVGARRNYMLTVVTLIVLAIANPPAIKIPSLGGNATLPAVLAFIGLWLAMFHLGWEYKVEHDSTAMDNSTASRENHDAEQTLLHTLRQDVEKYRNNVSRILEMPLL